MANWSDPRSNGATFATSTGARTEAYDAGLRSYMLSVYNYMTSGILLTGIVALLFATSGYAEQVFFSGGLLKYVIMLAPLGFVFGMSFGQGRMAFGTLQAMFWGFAVAMGLSLSTVFLQYSGTSVAQASPVDLPDRGRGQRPIVELGEGVGHRALQLGLDRRSRQIGRASCRERVSLSV